MVNVNDLNAAKLHTEVVSYVLLEGSGNSWNDFPKYWKINNEGTRTSFPKRIQMWTGAFLDKIQVTYDEGVMESHGGQEPGRITDIHLNNGEYIVKIEANYMPWDRVLVIRDLIMHTSTGKMHAFHSWADENNGIKHVEYTLPEGFGLVAIGGKTETEYNTISGITLYFAKISVLEGEIFHKKSISIEGIDAQTLELYSNNTFAASPERISVNAIEKIEIPSRTKTVLVAISETADGVAMPRNVEVTLFNKRMEMIQSISGQYVKMINTNFYQMKLDNPSMDIYYVYISARADAQMYYEVQMINDNVPILTIEEQLVIAFGKSQLPIFRRPEFKIEIIKKSPTLCEETSEASLLMVAPGFLHFMHTLCYGISTANWIVLGITLAVDIAFLCYNRGGTEEDTKKKMKKEREKKIVWGNDRTGYETHPNSTSIFCYSPDKEFYTFTKEIEDFYKYLLRKNNYCMEIDKIDVITIKEIKEYLKELPFRVDVGGEGCFNETGSGCKEALNFNTKYYNSQLKYKIKGTSEPKHEEIPFLIHFKDWETDNFPLEDHSVDSFLMTGCGNPTKHEADEMIRCIKKKNARIDFSAKLDVANYIADRVPRAHLEESTFSSLKEIYSKEMAEFSLNMKMYTIFIE